MTDRASQIRNARTAREPQQREDPDDELGSTAITAIVLAHVLLFAAGLVYLPLVHGNSIFLTALFAAVMGILPAYFFHDRLGFTKYSAVAIAESIVLAFLSGIAAAQHAAFKQLQALNQDLATGGAASATNLSTISFENTVHPDVLFVTTLLLFNAPFLYYNAQRMDTDWRYLGLYSLPILLYLGMRFIFAPAFASFFT